MTNEKKETHFTLCFRCGCPLTKQQTAVYFQGTYAKFFQHEVGTVTFYICQECEGATDKFIREGIRGAVHRMEEANRLDGGMTSDSSG